jgi:hypothetical protein
VHAHTGVKTHLIGPGDRRMVARSSVCVPTHASARVERGRGAAASQALVRVVGEVSRAPSVERRLWHAPCQYPNLGSD